MFWEYFSSTDEAFKNNCYAEMWSGSEEGLYSRLKDCVSLNSRLERNKEEKKTDEATWSCATVSDYNVVWQKSISWTNSSIYSLY